MVRAKREAGSGKRRFSARITCVVTAILVAAHTADAQGLTTLPLVPIPAHVTEHAGRLAFGDTIVISIPTNATTELKALGALSISILRDGTAKLVRLRQGTGRNDDLRLVLDGRASAHREGYTFTSDSTRAVIRASTGAGLFYGLQTLRQLLDASRTSIPGSVATSIPAVSITDAPRFPYRGLHLDVGRHFQPVEFVKRYIDLMARYKLNTFHWHLTEDQGWRVEIKRYPRLMSVGACRNETMLAKNFRPYVGDSTRHCGFYTQDEIRDVVRYARERYVTVIPEIEMPGHSKAAIASYPELACTSGPFDVRTTWGIDDDIFCPSEHTFAFVEGVLTEVLGMFPSRYIHIGGDEAPKTRWKASDVAQSVIRREGLKDEHELQSYFIRRVERFLLRHNRRLIGWDEILEGGLAPQATVMSWRGTAGGIAAAKAGHDVIMTPTSHLYFDYYQADPRTEPLAIGGHLPLDTVYAFEPVPAELTPNEARHILGAQGNVWTEYLKTAESIEYMVYPRAMALAEVVWSPRESRSWESFLQRVPSQLRALDRLGVNYRPLARYP